MLGLVAIALVVSVTPGLARDGGFQPVTITTPALSITGTGALFEFSPVTITTPTLSITGTGALFEFSPVTITTPALSITGTGALK